VPRFAGWGPQPSCVVETTSIRKHLERLQIEDTEFVGIELEDATRGHVVERELSPGALGHRFTVLEHPDTTELGSDQ